jgi:hypothetical protein
MKKKEHGLQAAAWLYQLLATKRVPISVHLVGSHFWNQIT